MGRPASTDITLIFKSCIKSIRTRNRACGIPEPDRKPEPRRVNPLAVRAREVMVQVSKMAAFIEDISSAYANFAGHIPGAPRMTDSERDRIDIGIPKLAAEAKAMLGDLEFAVAERKLTPHHKEHQLAVIKLIKDYLRKVAGRHSELRSRRIDYSKEIRQLARLDGMSRSKGTTEEKPAIPSWTPDDDDDSSLNNLSAEELQMFEEENNALQMELSGLMSELHTLEGTLTGVAKLQEQFTEKIVEQEMQIDQVFSTVVGTTENVKDANEQLRQAIQRNAGLRVYILFSLLVMSFSLLFLDWYND